jgi:hypothetical protein
MRAMRRLAWAVGVAGVALTLGAPGVHSAPFAYLDGAHWDVSAGPRPDVPAAVVVVDATGDPRVQEALRGFRAEWNAMRADATLAVLPAVELSFAGPEACSGPRQAALAGPHVLVCVDDTLANAAVGGPYRVDDLGHTVLALVKLRTATLAWSDCNLRTAMAHELGHVMGLAHNDEAAFEGGASVMMSGKGPYGHGCPAWFNAQDRAALRALYEQHARICGRHGAAI